MKGAESVLKPSLAINRIRTRNSDCLFSEVMEMKNV